MCIFTKGIFPDVLKTTKVIPLYKKGNQNYYKNYRPISLIPQLSKILDKLIKNQLLSFINKYNIISNCQYGFRKILFSTSDALADVVETVNANLE